MARCLFLKEARILHGFNHKNVVQFKAICSTPTAILLEYCCFHFSLFGGSDLVNTLEDFLHYIDRHDALDKFPFQRKIPRDIASGMTYLREQGIVQSNFGHSADNASFLSNEVNKLLNHPMRNGENHPWRSIMKTSLKLQASTPRLEVCKWKSIVTTPGAAVDGTDMTEFVDITWLSQQRYK